MSQSVPRRDFWGEMRQYMNISGLLGSPYPKHQQPYPTNL